LVVGCVGCVWCGCGVVGCGGVVSGWGVWGRVVGCGGGWVLFICVMEGGKMTP